MLGLKRIEQTTAKTQFGAFWHASKQQKRARMRLGSHSECVLKAKAPNLSELSIETLHR